MAPSPLTPISEESLPNFAEIKIQRENKSENGNKLGEDRGCLFFYDNPEVKGPFFDDEFFKSAQKNYEEAIQGILQRSNSADHAPGAVSNMTSYRTLRQTEGQQDTRASGLTENSDNYQISLDVHSYAPTEISVKAVGDQELLVEGHHVEQSPDGDGTSSSKSFSRRFYLPGLVKLDAVTSALSSDGVLTVTAPKRQQKNGIANSKANEMQPPASSNGILSSAFNEKENLYNEELGHLLNDMSIDSKTNFQHGNNLNNSSLFNKDWMNDSTSDMVEEDTHYKITLDISGYGPKDVSVKAVGDRELQIEGRHMEKSSAGAETNQSFSRRFCLPGPIKLEAITSSMSQQGVLTIRAPKELVQDRVTSATTSSKQNNKGDQEQQKTEHNNTTSSSNSSNSSQFNNFSNFDNNSQLYGNSLDDFFTKDFDMTNNINLMNQDSFMEKARKDYKESLENMMNRNWIIDSSAPEFFSKSVGHQMEDSLTQSSSDIIESADDYKMKLDVSKYRPEDISVKAVGERELLIEGHHTEKPSGGPSITHSFSRRFSLPGLVKLDAVTSSLAPGGVLTITAPKLAVTQH